MNTATNRTQSTATVETYRQVTPAGRHIRTATRVRFPDGRVVAFMERLGKREAIDRATVQLTREDK